MSSTPAWTDEEWDLRFGEVLFREIQEEEDRRGNRPSQFRISGRKSKKWPNKENQQFWLTEGPAFAKAYANWRMESQDDFYLWETPDGEPASELDLTVQFGTAKTRAIIDRVFVWRLLDEEKLIVVDLKSGANMPEDNLQLGYYAAAIDIEYGVRVDMGAYFDARKGGLAGIESLAVYPTEMIVDLVEKFVAQRNVGLALPNPGRQCTYCEVASACKWSKGVR